MPVHSQTVWKIQITISMTYLHRNPNHSPCPSLHPIHSIFTMGQARINRQIRFEHELYMNYICKRLWWIVHYCWPRGVNGIKTKRIRVECASQKCPFFAVVIKQQQVSSFFFFLLVLFLFKSLFVVVFVVFVWMRSDSCAGGFDHCAHGRECCCSSCANLLADWIALSLSHRCEYTYGWTGLDLVSPLVTDGWKRNLF